MNLPKIAPKQVVIVVAVATVYVVTRWNSVEVEGFPIFIVLAFPSYILEYIWMLIVGLTLGWADFIPITVARLLVLVPMGIINGIFWLIAGILANSFRASSSVRREGQR